VDSDSLSALIVLIGGLVAFILLVAAEAGIVAGVRERALREPAESRVDALRRFYHERQLTLSSLTFARSIALVGVTALVVFIVLREWSDSWWALAAIAFGTSAAFMVLQALPRLVVARSPDRWQTALAPFVTGVIAVFRWPVLILDAPMGALLRRWQARQLGEGEEAEELLLISEMEEAGAALEDEERQMIRGVIELEFTPVREVMVPRTDIVAIDVEDGFEELKQVMVERGFSRLPVYEENVDNIIGIAYGRQVLNYLAAGQAPGDLRDVVRPPHFVPEGKRIHELLAEMREKRISVAVVADEYGGTAGLVTIEDLLEEIVGELQDEFDIEEQDVQPITADDAIVDARVTIDELSEIFDVSLEKEDFDSVGGLIVNELGRMPSVGDHVRVNGISLKVLSVAGRRIKKVRVTKVNDHEEEPESASSK
jgi:CBS domain containing-hemolysin-like protein